MSTPYLRKCLLIIVLCLACPQHVKAYSVLTHQAIIDASWEKYIKPLLKKQFPASTDDDIKLAHSYAYGGCLIADMGYYPFGSEYYTDLAHYVRSGDFVVALVNEAQNVNEYAFALGAVCHYMADKYGHSLATNVAVPLLYPKIKKKYGDWVTYDEDRLSHGRMEFAFDVLQTARGNYASSAFHDFIGFNVAQPVLERAFVRTYGQDINAVFGDLHLAISTFRWAVKNLFPGMMKTAWAIKKDDIKKSNPDATGRKFRYRMSRKQYYEEFGRDREKPGFKAEMFAFMLKLMPKVGPLKALKFIPPSAEVEKLFIRSFDTVLVHYTATLTKLNDNKLVLPDIDFDTGKPTVMGEYPLTDFTYGELVFKLQETKFNKLTQPLKQNIIGFYSTSDTIAYAKKYPGEWKKASLALTAMRKAPVIKMDTLKTDTNPDYKKPTQ